MRRGEKNQSSSQQIVQINGLLSQQLLFLSSTGRQFSSAPLGLLGKTLSFLPSAHTSFRLAKVLRDPTPSKKLFSPKKEKGDDWTNRPWGALAFKAKKKRRSDSNTTEKGVGRRMRRERKQLFPFSLSLHYFPPLLSLHLERPLLSLR